MAYTLTDFEANGFTWTEADESRPDVKAPEIPAELSDRGQRVLKANARLRGVWDESVNGFPGDSERAYSLAWHAGFAGLSIEDATWLLCDLYSRPGKKGKPHRSKLQKTLRAWAKGREEAEREGAAAPREPEADHEPDMPPNGAGKASPPAEAPPYEVLPAAQFAAASFAGAVRLVPSIGLTECGVGLLTGQGGDGKSLTAMNLGGGWSGMELPLSEAIAAARTLRVLLVYVEDLPGMVQERFNILRGTSPIPEGLFFFTRNEPMRFSGARGKPNEKALERLRVTLHTHRPIDLVVFDPLVYLHEAEENSSSEMMRWLVPLREVCRQEGAALLIVHYAGWASDGDDARGRGTTAIRAWADFELALRSQTKGGRVLHRLNLVKCNFARRWKDPLSLELDPNTLRFRVVDESETLCSPAALVAWMTKDLNGIWSEKRLDLYAAICRQFGCSDKTARDGVASAVRAGLLKDHGQRKPLEVVANSEDTLI